MTPNGSLTDEIVREGARRMLAAALEAEVNGYLAELAGQRDEAGLRLVVRNGQRSPPGRPRARRHPVREGRPRRARGGERGITGLGTSTVHQRGALLSATRETQLSLDS